MCGAGVVRWGRENPENAWPGEGNLQDKKIVGESTEWEPRDLEGWSASWRRQNTSVGWLEGGHNGARR